MGRLLWSLVWAKETPAAPSPPAHPPAPARVAPPPPPAPQPTRTSRLVNWDDWNDEDVPELIDTYMDDEERPTTHAQENRLARTTEERLRAWPGMTSRATRLPDTVREALFIQHWAQNETRQQQGESAPTAAPAQHPPSPTSSAAHGQEHISSVAQTGPPLQRTPTPGASTAHDPGRNLSAAPPSARAPSPARPIPTTSGWDDWTGDWSAHLPSRWAYDAHPDHHGWDASAEGHAAALILGAAYREQRPVNGTVPMLDMLWHRPDQHEANPLGYNQRGDLAPPLVHDTLVDVLRGKAMTPLEVVLLHNWVDTVWLRHSRSEARCAEVVRRLELFDEREVALLVTAIHAEPLTDFRVLMHSVDPRELPVYGRTMDSEGESRLFRMFPAVLARTDTTVWDNDDGGMSGSSRAGSEDERPYSLTAEQRLEQRLRHVERRARRALPRAEAAEVRMDAVEQRLRDLEANLPQAEAAIAVLRRGINAPSEAEERARIWEGWS